MRRVAVLLVCGMACAGSAIAKDGDASAWFKLGNAEDNLKINRYSAKKGSFRHSNKESSFLMQDSEENKVTKKINITYNKVGISDTDCENGYGKTKFYSLDGTFLYDSDYIEDGESVGSNIGQFLCSVRTQMMKDGKI